MEHLLPGQVHIGGSGRGWHTNCAGIPPSSSMFSKLKFFLVFPVYLLCTKLFTTCMITKQINEWSITWLFYFDHIQNVPLKNTDGEKFLSKPATSSLVQSFGSFSLRRLILVNLKWSFYSVHNLCSNQIKLPKQQIIFWQWQKKNISKLCFH